MWRVELSEVLLDHEYDLPCQRASFSTFLNLFAAPVRSLTAAKGRDSPAFTSKTANHTLQALVDFTSDLIKCRGFYVARSGVVESICR